MMDKKLKELRQARAKAIEELQALVDGDKAVFDAKEAEVHALDVKIKQAERALELSASLARPSTTEEPGLQQQRAEPGSIMLDPYFEASLLGRQVRRVPPF